MLAAQPAFLRSSCTSETPTSETTAFPDNQFVPSPADSRHLWEPLAQRPPAFLPDPASPLPPGRQAGALGIRLGLRAPGLISACLCVGRKYELYSMDWDLKEELRDCLVAAAPYGGPIGRLLTASACYGTVG